MLERVDWVCLDCATKLGARIPHNHQPTWHVDKCDICEEEKEVTEPRDFGTTRHLIVKGKKDEY